MHLEYFQLIDRIEKIDLDTRTIECLATVPETSTIFEGHFPGHPLMPGTLMIESMAQTCGYLILGVLKFDRLPYLIQVDKAKIRTFIEPGTKLMVHASLIHDGSGFAVASGKIENDAGPVAQAELRFRTMPFPNDALKETVRDYAGKVGLK